MYALFTRLFENFDIIKKRQSVLNYMCETPVILFPEAVFITFTFMKFYCFPQKIFFRFLEMKRFFPSGESNVGYHHFRELLRSLNCRLNSSSAFLIFPCCSFLKSFIISFLFCLSEDIEIQMRLQRFFSSLISQYDIFSHLGIVLTIELLALELQTKH